jgi:hypothetical protein
MLQLKIELVGKYVAFWCNSTDVTGLAVESYTPLEGNGSPSATK